MASDALQVIEDYKIQLLIVTDENSKLSWCVTYSRPNRGWNKMKNETRKEQKIRYKRARSRTKAVEQDLTSFYHTTVITQEEKLMKLIAEGRVKVNGKVVTNLATKVSSK